MFCEFCSPVEGTTCIVCGHDHGEPGNGPAVPQDRRIARLRVRQAENEIAEAEGRIRRLRAGLPALRLAADMRPGDGSDQPALFTVEPESLFSEV